MFLVTRKPQRRHADLPGLRAACGGKGGAMTSTSMYLPSMTDGRRLAKVRERFLAADAVEPGQVRDTILASWWRSRRWNVAANHIDIAYVRDPDLDTPLTRSALPVLRTPREHPDGQPISILPTDAAGVRLHPPAGAPRPPPPPHNRAG